MKLTALIATIAVLGAEAVMVSKHHHHTADPVDPDIKKFRENELKEDGRLKRLNKAKKACSSIKDGHKRFVCKQKAYDKAI